MQVLLSDAAANAVAGPRRLAPSLPDEPIHIVPQVIKLTAAHGILSIGNGRLVALMSARSFQNTRDARSGRIPGGNRTSPVLTFTAMPLPNVYQFQRLLAGGSSARAGTAQSSASSRQARITTSVMPPAVPWPQLHRSQA